jgi:hypothetical protein
LYHLCLINICNEAVNRSKNLINNSCTEATDYKNVQFVLPEHGTNVTKHVGDPLIFSLFKVVHLVGVINGLLRYKNAWNGQFKPKTLLQKFSRCLQCEGR